MGATDFFDALVNRVPELCGSTVRTTPAHSSLVAEITSPLYSVAEKQPNYFSVRNRGEEIGIIDLKDFVVGIACRLKGELGYETKLGGQVIIQGVEACKALQVLLGSKYGFKREETLQTKLLNRLHEYHHFAINEQERLDEIFAKLARKS